MLTTCTLEPAHAVTETCVPDASDSVVAKSGGKSPSSLVNVTANSFECAVLRADWVTVTAPMVVRPSRARLMSLADTVAASMPMVASPLKSSENRPDGVCPSVFDTETN